MNRPKLWTKDFLIVSSTNFFLYFTFFLLIATISIFAIEHFKATPSEAGLASGIFVIGTLVARLFAGRSIDQIGRRKMLFIGFIALLVTSLLYFFINDLLFLYVIRFLHGAALGIASTATGTIVASIIPNERRGEGIGYYALSMTLAAAIGPFLGMFINQHASFNVNFMLCTVLIVVSFVTSLFLNVPEMVNSKEQLDKLKGFRLSNFFEPKAIPISIISIFIGLGYSGVLSFLTSYSIQIHLVNVASFFFVFYAVAILVSRPFTGRWFDTKGENFVMYPAFLLFTIGLLMISQVQQGFFLLLAGMLIGFGYGTFTSSAQAISIKVSPKDRIALATSTYYIFADVGIGIGPFLLGFLIPIIDYRGLYVFLAIVVFSCTILYYFLHGRKAGHMKKLAKMS